MPLFLSSPGWADAGGFKPILAQHPDGVIIDKHSLRPIEDGTGKVLGHPPIHIHHIHVVEDAYGDGSSVRTRTSFQRINISLAAEQHGDYQCLEEQGGMDCFLETNPPGMGRLMTKPWDIEGDINDVRAPRSEKLVWWYEAAFRWTPEIHNLQQISKEFVVGPGRFDPWDQATYVLTYPTKTKEPSLYWYTGEMWASGSLIRNKLHGHNSIFHSAYWINASPEELGLDDPKFMPVNAFTPQFIRADLGFDGIDHLAKWILDHLELPENKKKGRRVICKGFVQGEMIGGFHYDRRAPCNCGEWEFKKGDPFTVISFSEHNGESAGPHSPNSISEEVPSHVHFVMQYMNHDTATSAYAASLWSQTGYSGGTRSKPNLFEALYILYVGGNIQGSEVRFLQSREFFCIVAVSASLLVGLPVAYWFRRSRKNRTVVEETVDAAAESAGLLAGDPAKKN